MAQNKMGMTMAATAILVASAMADDGLAGSMFKPSRGPWDDSPFDQKEIRKARKKNRRKRK